MSKSREIIIEAFRKPQAQGQSYIGKVVSVSGNNAVVEIAGIEYDANIEVVEGEDSQKVFASPAVGSFVLVADLSGEKRAMVILKIERAEFFEIQIEEIIYRIDNGHVWVKKEGGDPEPGVLGNKNADVLTALKIEIGNLNSAVNDLINLIGAFGLAQAAASTPPPLTALSAGYGTLASGIAPIGAQLTEIINGLIEIAEAIPTTKSSVFKLD